MIMAHAGKANSQLEESLGLKEDAFSAIGAGAPTEVQH